MKTAIVVALVASRIAAAEPTASPEPDAASGVLVEAPIDDWMWLPRAALWPVRIATKAVLAPFRGGAWAFERYQVKERIVSLLFSDDGTMGVYPTAFFETGLGLNAGLHFIDGNLAGHGEMLKLGAGYGGDLQQHAEGSLSSGFLLFPTRIVVSGGYRAWNRYNYFGIGNDASALQTHFAQRVWSGQLEIQRPIGPVVVAAAGDYTQRTFESELDPMTLVGFATGTHAVTAELSISFDTTTFADRYISRANPSSGWCARVFVDATEGLRDDASRYLRYGADVSRYVDLYRGDRVLVLHATYEAVTASLDQIPVVDLPRLGGGDILRGFHRDRFRDRVAVLASAEYRFPVHDGVTGFLFVDAGEVASAPSHITTDLHLGYGGGLQLQTHDAYLLRLQLAGSDEGTFFQLALQKGRRS